jgi:hypothetical protein
MAVEGVDYADARPSPSGLYAAGKRFAVRYGGPGRDSKQLHSAELAALRAAGLDVVANAEGAADGYRGRDAGRAWAISARDHFTALGMPADRPIYFSVDWDADSADWAAIDAALRGSAEILGAARVGVYGSYDVIAHCVAAGTARWFWQTYAWSGGRWHPRAHIQQYKNGVTVAGGSVDLNRAITADYGQWGYTGGDDMALADDKIVITADTAAEIGKQAGDQVSAATLLQLAVIHAARSADSAAAALKVATAANAGVTDLKAAVDLVDEEVWAKVPDPGVTAAEKAALLRAVLGDDAATVGALLAAG